MGGKERKGSVACPMGREEKKNMCDSCSQVLGVMQREGQVGHVQGTVEIQEGLSYVQRGWLREQRKKYRTSFPFSSRRARSE